MCITVAILVQTAFLFKTVKEAGIVIMRNVASAVTVGSETSSGSNKDKNMNAKVDRDGLTNYAKRLPKPYSVATAWEDASLDIAKAAQKVIVAMMQDWTLAGDLEKHIETQHVVLKDKVAHRDFFSDTTVNMSRLPLLMVQFLRVLTNW